MIKPTYLLVLCILAGCNAHRFPSPMGGPEELPPGFTDMLLEGPEEALLVRHADTVHVKRAGQTSVHRLHFYDRQARIHAGAAVLTDAGGRAELIFPGGSVARMHGNGILVVGSPSRGEPFVSFLQLERASVEMEDGEVVRLPGGSHLMGDGGPFYLEKVSREVLELRHRGYTRAVLAFGTKRIVLTPGDVLHLPLLPSGSAPQMIDPDHKVSGSVGAVPLVLGPGVVLPGEFDGHVKFDLLSGQGLSTLGVQVVAVNDQHLRLSDLAHVSSEAKLAASAEVTE